MGKKNRKDTGFYFDYSLLFVLIFIVGFGLTMIYSTSSYTAQIEQGDPEYYFKRQLIFTILGMAAMFFIARFFDYHHLLKLSPFIFIISLIIIILVPFIGREVNGAKRWIYIGPVSFQPAELVKIAVIIFCSAKVCNAGTSIKKFRRVVRIFLGVGVIPAVAILVCTSNLSSAIIVCGIAVVITFVAYPGYKIYVAIVAALSAAFLAFYTWLTNVVNSGRTFKNFRLTRFLVWLNPEKYIDGKGYQTVQGLYAIGSGGLFGKGLGKSLQKLGFIPESQNDMIFSIICEELGLFGAACVIIMFVILLWRVIHISQNAPDLFGSLLAVGVFAHIAIQVIINIAVVTNVFPNTGVTLPFISYGGTASVFLLAELGIVLNISSQIRLER
ncbi:MAG: FtsW/RodA/SpoVE family cell cycle protein [Eubacteriales bacterium]|nr:FtsW/RodA/SpoVE family cell cycle protein [Eubacteriales bacterium]